MGIRVDPRSGMIIPGTSRPVKKSVSISRNPLRRNTQTTKVQESHSRNQTLASFSVQDIRDLAKEIGTIIAAQISKHPVSITTLSDPNVYRLNVSKSPSISIDESVIDVGIGKQDPLQKGKGSGSLAKEVTKSDALQHSKSILSQLKRKK